jgi:hypothetical protein
MKKLIALFSALLISTMLLAQSNMITMVPDTTGTIIGVDNATTTGGNIHKFTAGVINTGYSGWAIEVFVTATGTHATDSTRVTVYGSMDGTNYFKITDLGTPWLLGGAAYRAGTDVAGYRLSDGGGATGGWIWKVASPMTYRYLRVQIAQFKKSSILTVNRCKLHLFKSH